MVCWVVPDPRLQTCQPSLRADRPDGWVVLSANEVWDKPIVNHVMSFG